MHPYEALECLQAAATARNIEIVDNDGSGYNWEGSITLINGGKLELYWQADVIRGEWSNPARDRAFEEFSSHASLRKLIDRVAAGECVRA